MAKPYKLRDGNGHGNLREHTGRYSEAGKAAPRPTDVYPGLTAKDPGPYPLQPDKVPSRSPQDTFGKPPVAPKPFRAG